MPSASSSGTPISDARPSVHCSCSPSGRSCPGARQPRRRDSRDHRCRHHAAAARIARRPTTPCSRRVCNRPGLEIGLRSLRLFAALPPPEIEGLARGLEPLSAAVGEAVVVQGDDGDRYYAIADGEFEVVVDGRRLSTLGRGDGFGEIALLHDVARTATVTALTKAKLYSLEKERSSRC